MNIRRHKESQPEIKLEEIKNAFQMIQIDFTQRSQHVVQLALDRSKFLRICLLVWGTPLLIAGTLLKTQIDVARLSQVTSQMEVIAISFLAASLVNCAILCSMLGNRNSSILATSAMNYLRSFYFNVLIENNIGSIDESVRRVVNSEKSKPTPFRLYKSRSTDLSLILITITNLTYACLGLYLSPSTKICLISLVLLLIVFVSHLFVLRIMRLPVEKSIK